jgi:hypothetical protein
LRSLLNDVPAVWLLVAAACLAVVIVIPAVLLVRHFVPATREGYHAEISAPMLGVVAALFGLFLAFVIIIAYQNYLTAQTNVSREAQALSAIVRDSEAFPEPGGREVRASVGDYSRAVVFKSWRLMRTGRVSGVATADLNGIFAALRGVRPDSTQSRTFYEDAVTQANTAASAREDRLGSVAGGIPSVIVILVLFNTLVIVGYAVFVGSPSFFFHALGPTAIAVVVAVSIVVLFDLSYPFSGSVTVSTHDLRSGELEQFFKATAAAPR